MIASFKEFDKGTRYYYPLTNCALLEGALSALPNGFVREFIIKSDCIYIESTIDYLVCIDPRDEVWIFQYIRSLYQHIWSSCKQVKGKYTYISRRKATVRRILNETDYLDNLKQLGISVYCMEDLSFVDQIKLFAESEILTGPHGAAFSFAVFCQPGTLLYEIYRADQIKNHYVILASECGLNYKRFYDVAFDEVTHDMTINKESYIDSLRSLIMLTCLSDS
jgi:hypothetical protein